MRIPRLALALLSSSLLCCAGTLPARATLSDLSAPDYGRKAEIQNVGHWSGDYGYRDRDYYGGYGGHWNDRYGDNYYRPRHYYRPTYNRRYYDDDCYY